MRSPQRTEDRLRARGEDGAYLRAPPFEGVGGWLKQWPRAAKRKTRSGLSASTGRTASFAAAARRERYAAAWRVRRSNARSVRGLRR